MYRLKAVAKDKTGITSRREIQIAVGNVLENSKANWRDEIHQVILNEGERLMAGDVRDFPRLECYLAVQHDGKVVLYRGAPGKGKGLIWKTPGKDAPGPHYAAFENGQLVLYRGMLGHPEVALWKSRKPSDAGPYQFGITASKRLLVFREVEGKKRKIAWRSR